MPTLTFYPDAHPETTSVDGIALHRDNAGLTWADLVAAAGNDSSDLTDGHSIAYIESDNLTDKWNSINRGIFLFDTSALPNNTTIISAILSFYGSGGSGDTPGWLPNINIYASAPVGDTGLVGGDYDSLGSTPFCDTPIAIGSWNDAGYNDFILNADGIAAISKTGISKFGVRNANYDVADVAPTWVASRFAVFNAYTAEKGGDYRPKLVVTHTPGVIDAGYIWVETTYLHYIDASGDERSFEGTDTTVNGEAGYLWVEGTYLHYIDENGDERRKEGTDTTANATERNLYIETTELHYIDANGDERYIEGATV